MAQKTYPELLVEKEVIKTETASNANTAERIGQMFENIIDSIVSREFGRTWSSELLFDKNEIDYAPHEVTTDTTFTIAASGNLSNAFSSSTQILVMDGESSINFTGFDFIYGIGNGDIPDAGRYQLFFLYRNGIATANWMEPSSEVANLTPLNAPGNFTAAPDGENAIDLTWDDVANESSYLIEFSLTGTGGWSTLSTPASGSTSASQVGLNAGDTRFYRIKAVSDGINFTDSAFVEASATTEDTGDVTAPTFTFLPASGNTDWPVNKVITITANEGLQNTDGSEITNANVASRITVKQTNSGGADISFTATIDATKTIITITPATIWGDTQLVYVAINNVEDVNGNEVTVAQSITFTSTDFTEFNGSSNRLVLGDILDSLFAANDTNFWLETTIKNYTQSGARVLYGKSYSAGNQRSFYFYFFGTDVYFAFFPTVTSGNSRLIKWTGALDGSEQVLVLKYDGSIDTGDGLNRLTLLVDGVTAGSKTLDSSVGTLGNIANATAQLGIGILLTHTGVPDGTSWFSGEMKDVIIRSNAGATVELNIPIIKTGTDTSGNARNGTWV